MTRIMQQSYGYTFSGITKYLINRFLRIYPLYWLSVLISFLLILLASEYTISSLSQSIFLPHSLEDTVRNIFIFFSFNTEPRLTPPSWALTVELFYYLLIAAGFSRTRKITILWFLLSLLYTIYLLLSEASFSYRYFTISSASLPFSLGCALYFIPVRKETNHSNKNIIILSLLIFLNYIFSLYTNTENSFGFYINLFLVAGLIFNLSLIKDKQAKKLDTALGNLSYPIYLFHYQCGIIVFSIFSLTNMSTKKGEFSFFILSLTLCLALSYLVANVIESKIELLRNKIRPLRVIQ